MALSPFHELPDGSCPAFFATRKKCQMPHRTETVIIASEITKPIIGFMILVAGEMILREAG
jgi:hypothetical protein